MKNLDYWKKKFQSNLETLRIMSSEKLFQFHFSVLKFVGFELNYENNWKGTFSKFRAGFLFGSAILFVVLTAHFVLNNLEDFITVMNSLSFCTSSISMLMKYSNFFYMKSKLSELVISLRFLYDQGKLNWNSLN